MLLGIKLSKYCRCMLNILGGDIKRQLFNNITIILKFLSLKYIKVFIFEICSIYTLVNIVYTLISIIK